MNINNNITFKSYHLSDAFNTLGCHLYRDDWSGYEIWGRKAVDPGPVLKARSPVEQELNETIQLRNIKEKELKEVLGREDIHRINNELTNLRDKQHSLYSQLNDIGNPSDSAIEDRGRWERYEYVESRLLQAFRNGDLKVTCLLGLDVKPELWTEMPNYFGFDWELSLIFMPERETSQRANSGQIDSAEFEGWLEQQMPRVESEEVELSPFVKCRKWLKKMAQEGPKPSPRDDLMFEARIKFPGLTERSFLQAWAAEVPESWKRGGAPKKIK